MKNWIQKTFKNERGLTLVELLAVIVILAIVGTIAFVMIGNVIENSRKDAFVADAQQMIASAKLYEAEGKESGDYTVTLEDLQDGGYIEEFVDPWDNKSVTEGEVEKEDGDYSVTLTSPSDKGQDIDATETEIQQGRETVYGEDN